MLLRFSVQNWMSFRDKATFSMLAGSERQHSERLIRVRKYRMRILPIAALYGGNASGKTNLVAALSFARALVVRGTHPDERIPVYPFLLDSQSAQQPTRFAFELLVDEVMYEYSFEVTASEVVSEKLVKITSTSERTQFERQAGKIEFAPRLNRDPFLHFAFTGTRENELFLTNSVSQKVDRFRPISDWFRDCLRLSGPETTQASRLSHNDSLRWRIGRLLQRFDTGIEGLRSTEIPLEAIPMSEDFRIHLSHRVKEGAPVIIAGPDGQLVSVSRQAGKLQATRLEAQHRTEDGGFAGLDIAMESDGSRRLIELLPFLVELSDYGSGAVLVIDEMDRSLHPSLSRALVEGFLAGVGEHSRAQLILTTHDVQLMDQLLLRRDEMWVAERLRGGTTRLYSFSEFSDLRIDTNVRQSYLDGRLGGVPHIAYSSTIFQDDTSSTAS